MGIFNFSFPIELLKKVNKKESVLNFIETGTYMGYGARLAAKYFPNIHSIELSEKYYNLAKTDAPKNITFHLGNSVDVLPRILSKINGLSVFWLDAHYSGGDTAGIDFRCPILKELSLINEYAEKNDTILLIDDARFFLSPINIDDKYLVDYPRIDTLYSKLNEVSNRYIICIEDVIICCPIKFKDIMEEYSYSFYDRIGVNLNRKINFINKMPRLFNLISRVFKL